MRFISKKYSRLRLVLEPKRFREVDGRRMIEAGKTVEFENGEYETKDLDIIDRLLNHPHYGYMFFSPEEKGAVKKTKEAAKDENEKKAAAEKVEETVKTEDEKVPVKNKK